MGRGHDARRPRRRARRPRTRSCLFQGCEARFRPAHWRTRYCSPTCRDRATRWLAATRQRRRRRSPDARRKHREAEKARRDAAKSASPSRDEGARGHAKVRLPDGPVCNRPGCYRPPVEARSRAARFCCAACRGALQRVIDRERKWLLRGRDAGRFKRLVEYERRARRSGAMGSQTAPD
jgi:hypothetical protein